MKSKNMTLENQVTSLELSKRLKELGVKQESYFYWVSAGNNPFELVSEGDEYGIDGYDEYVSAYTVAELGEILPTKCKSYKGGNDFYWACELKNDNGYISKSGSSTEVDARAKMLIYLLENDIELPHD